MVKRNKNSDDDSMDENEDCKKYNDTPYELSVYQKPNIYHLKINKSQYYEYSLEYNEMVRLNNFEMFLFNF